MCGKSLCQAVGCVPGQRLAGAQRQPPGRPGIVDAASAAALDLLTQALSGLGQGFVAKREQMEVINGDGGAWEPHPQRRRGVDRDNLHGQAPGQRSGPRVENLVGVGDHFGVDDVGFVPAHFDSAQARGVAGADHFHLAPARSTARASAGPVIDVGSTTAVSGTGTAATRCECPSSAASVGSTVKPIRWSVPFSNTLTRRCGAVA